MKKRRSERCSCGVVKDDHNTSKNGDYFVKLCKACARRRALTSRLEKMTHDELMERAAGYKERLILVQQELNDRIYRGGAQ